MDALDPTAGRGRTGEAKALVKGVAALDALAAAPEGLGPVEVAAATGLPKATAHRFLTTLVDLGLVRQLGGGRYGLGPHCLTLGQAYLEAIDLRREAIADMRRLRDETGETCHLGLLTGGQIVYIEKVDSPHPVRMYSRVGATSQATTTGLGKAILAFSDPAVVDEVLSVPIARRTPGSVTDPAATRRGLRAARKRGFAVDDVENEEGIRCVAAPILDYLGQPVAGLSIAGPVQRITRDRIEPLGAAVRVTAEAISRALGFQGPFPGE